MKRIGTLVLLSLVISLKIFAAFHIGNMEVEHLSSPLGIDTPNPQFSWQLASDERGCLQVNYQIVVTDAEGTEVWNSGVVDADLPYGVIYAGAPLCSKSQYQWTLTVTDNRGRKASSQATFETAFLTPDEWKARWIGRSVERTKPSMEIVLDAPQHCRYLRLRITKLGTPASTDPNYTFVQLDEMEIYAGDENVALGATFKASSSWVVGNWHLNYINDGRIGDAAHLGWIIGSHSRLHSSPFRICQASFRGWFVYIMNPDKRAHFRTIHAYCIIQFSICQYLLKNIYFLPILR